MAEIRSPDGLGEDSVAVTFDDGSESVYTVAYPLLAKYDVPATVFLVSGWIETGCMSWWQLLCELVEKADLNDATSAQIRDVFGPSVPNLPDTNERDISIRRRFALGVAASLRTMPDRERTDKLDRLQELLFPRGDFVPEDSRVLTWQQIAEMASKRIDFESHSQTHVNIPTADLSTVEEEIRQSKAEIEQHTQREVTGFAYPYGKDLASYVAVEPVLRKHGFTYACNACRGSNSAGSNLYSLYRYSLPLTTSEALIGRELCVFLRRGKPGRD